MFGQEGSGFVDAVFEAEHGAEPVGGEDEIVNIFFAYIRINPYFCTD